MTSQEYKNVNLSILAISFKLKALQACLTDDQKIVFEASLKESQVLVQKTLAPTLNQEEVSALLDSLQSF